MAEQLDMFRDQLPPAKSVEPVGADGSADHAPEWIRPPAKQLTDLPGETFEDIFGGAA